ncbi:ABC transporter permease [Xanthomonas euvesicatoria]|uniref:ABC transporter permease n=1 Tax=Xanthomonas euvesicatoria TaxID=456327 RepID=UPI002406C1D1|nr:ABC transporter permease [Xanthomonas euvesicatoria]MCP3043454.1 ABC transporter permease [Xanthomonas euvesicatoria pv. allii]
MFALHQRLQKALANGVLALAIEPFTLLGKQRSLFARMVGRDISSRYKGSVFGLLWTILNPLVLLAVFGFVFGTVLKAKWGVGTKDNFSLVLFSGLSVFLLASECLNRAPMLIIQHSTYVKKVVFPLPLLPPIVVGSAFINFCVAISLLLLAQLFITGEVYLSWFAIPVVIAPLLMMLTGLVYLISALGVFLRDLSQIMGLFTLVLMYMSPILFPMETVPVEFRDYFFLNPVTVPVNELRGIILAGITPGWTALGIYTSFSLAVLLSGHWFFLRCQRGFADVL